jgi:hypothetical protein
VYGLVTNLDSDKSIFEYSYPFAIQAALAAVSGTACITTTTSGSISFKRRSSGAAASFPARYTPCWSEPSDFPTP